MTKWEMPDSPALTLLSSGILSPILGNSPPKFLPLLLGETVQHTTYDGMSVVQITPAHPDGNYVVAIHGGAFILPPTDLSLARLHGDGLPDRRDH